MRTYNNWNKKDIEALVESVENENKRESNMSVFSNLAKKYNLSPLTIRNIYYKSRTDKKMKYKHFDMEESKSMFNQINNLVSKGNSVRKACLIMAGEDQSLFLRYQNKYRKMLKQASQNVKTIKTKDRRLTDIDIQNLFMAVAGLIKKSTAFDIGKYYKTIINDYHLRLNNALIELNKKNTLLSEVLKENEKLKGENINIDKLFGKVKEK